MPATDPPPHATLRVLVKGSSLVMMTPERAPARGAHLLSRWAELEAAELGVPLECWNAGILSEPTKHAFREWETQLMAWMPDVVVYGYGFYECIHAFLPRGLEKHVNSPRWRRGSIRTPYRSYLLRPVWKVLAQSQRVLDARLQDRLFRRRLRRVLDDYELLVRRTRALGSPLVLVLELLPPAGRAASWFPGMAARIAATNHGIRALVEALDDPDVRIIEVAQLAGQLPPGCEALPDGLHYSPEMRRLIGRLVAQEVVRWQTGQRPAPATVPESDAGTPGLIAG